MDYEITHNKARSRFQINLSEEDIAKVNYRMVGDDTIAYIHTRVPDEYGGQGIASQLARHVLEYAREQGLNVIPQCPFISAYIRRHPEYKDLVAG